MDTADSESDLVPDNKGGFVDLTSHPQLLRFAAYLLDMAGDEFSNHGSNGIEVAHLAGDIGVKLTVPELNMVDHEEFEEYRAADKAPEWLNDDVAMHRVADLLRSTAACRELGIGAGRG